MIPDNDRRRFPRLPVRVDVHCNAFQEGKLLRALSTQSENLGVGGLSIQSDQPLPAGLKMLISFFLPMAREWNEPRLPLPVIARSRVAWCRTEERGFRLGIEFTDINPYSRDLFQTFLNTYPAASS